LQAEQIVLQVEFKGGHGGLAPFAFGRLFEGPVQVFKGADFWIEIFYSLGHDFYPQTCRVSETRQVLPACGGIISNTVPVTLTSRLFTPVKRQYANGYLTSVSPRKYTPKSP